MEKSLLDELAKRLCDPCLSDMKRKIGTPAFRLCIQQIPYGQYPLEEWVDCVSYLAPHSPKPATEDEARRRLALRWED